MGREGRDYWEEQLSEYWDSGLTIQGENRLLVRLQTAFVHRRRRNSVGGDSEFGVSSRQSGGNSAYADGVGTGDYPV